MRCSYCAVPIRRPSIRVVGVLLVIFPFLAGCATLNMGVSVPIGRGAGVGVSVGSDGRIGVGAGVSVGAGSVHVGTSGKPPTSKGAGSGKEQ